MSLGEAIFARLTAAQSGDTAPMTAALAVLANSTTGAGTRVYPRISDENVYPCIVYETTQEMEDSLEPLTGKEFGLSLRHVCRGEGAYKQAHLLKVNTRILLDRKRGTWGGIICKCLLQGSDEEDSADGGNQEALFFEVIDEYKVWANA